MINQGTHNTAFAVIAGLTRNLLNTRVIPIV